MRRRLRRWYSCTAIATAVTVVGFSLLTTAPAQAGTTQSSASQTSTTQTGITQAGTTQTGTTQAGAATGSSPATTSPDLAAAHYTNAPCNTTSTKAEDATCFATVYTAVKGKIASAAGQPPATALGPADLQSAYDLPSATAGKGETVAIVDALGDSKAEADLASFRSYYGLPACTTANGCFSKVAQDGSTNYPADNSGWGLETSLDLDAVSAACPNCHILLVEGDTATVGDLSTAEDEAVALGAKFVSNSWGTGGESSTDTSLDAHFDHPGVAIDFASGDTGNLVSWPATDGDVTSVGGTTLTRDTSASRGWDESVWGDGITGDEGGGSGCSAIEPRPAYQKNITTDCPNGKGVADVSADANPYSGLATYDTLGYAGWIQVGGTSLSTPLVTAMYALAGPPAPGTYPVTYPYDDANQSGDLNDITSGSDGSCGNLLCNAGTGWDGPTGLGTPHGVGALSGGPHGDISGQVTSTSGDPVVGATVTATAAATGGYSTTTDASGDYVLPVPPGSYDLTAAEYGYLKGTASGVTVAAGDTTTENVALTVAPDQTVSGTVTDGSGHGWPLYAKITIAGYPGSPIYTNPYTGRYSVKLQQSSDYTLHIAPVYPGYTTDDVPVHVGTAAVVQNAQPTIDATTCNAPGYAPESTGVTETFSGWSGTTPQDGWTNADDQGNGDVWNFSDPDGITPPKGSGADFAIADSIYYNFQPADTQLISPVVAFDTDYIGLADDDAFDLDVSVDGGDTWTTAWKSIGYVLSNSGPVSIPIPQAAGQSDVRVRFRYVTPSGLDGWWEVGNVFIGQTCGATKSGLVAGVVTDANTGKQLDYATVAGVSNPGESGVTAQSADPAFPHGFYWLTSTALGRTKFTATDDGYTTSTATVDVAENGVIKLDYQLKAGRVSPSRGNVSVTEHLGEAKSTNLKLTNTGTSPVQVTLGEQDDGFTPPTGQATSAGAPLQQIKGTFSTGPAATIGKASGATPAASSPREPAPDDPAWADGANYPTTIGDNAAVYDPTSGDVYSIAGWNGNASIAHGYVYSPVSQQWTAIADAPQELDLPAGAYLDGKIYVVGGWTPGATVHDPSSALYAYDPSGDSWTQLASLPAGVAATSAVALNGQLYVVGGCTTGECYPLSQDVYRYDPASNAWTQLANYPTAVAYQACAGIDNEIVCAGGVGGVTGTLSSTYLYNPASNSWSQGADMPYETFAMGAGGSGNSLQVFGGVEQTGPSSLFDTVITNRAEQYDPSSNTWSALPNTNDAVYRAGSACGLYEVGGTDATGVSAQVQTLPGYDACSGTDQVPWLSVSKTKFTIQPGQSVTVSVRTNSATLAAPGTYKADLTIGTDSPYHVNSIAVTMKVGVPASWSKIDGTVTDASTGDPIGGATVQVCETRSKSSRTCGPVSYTLTTDSKGHYQTWLAHGSGSLLVTASSDGYESATKPVEEVRGTTVTTNCALTKKSS